jgi:ATP adenylyltransferase
MEHLWAPWRNSYIGTMGKDSVSQENLFLEIGQSSQDEANHVIHRSKSCYALLNRFPYNTAHLMVIPYRKAKELEGLSTDEQMDLWSTVQAMIHAIRACYQPQGFNIGLNIGAAAGAGIPDHLHIHLVPRWAGDANFMTTTAETRVHPSDLDTIYRDLKSKLSH